MWEGNTRESTEVVLPFWGDVIQADRQQRQNWSRGETVRAKLEALGSDGVKKQTNS